MTAGLIAKPASTPSGLIATIEAAGITISQANDGWSVSDIAGAQSIISTYSGSASELSWWKTQQQAALDAFFNAHFDLAAFIRGGTVTTVTGNQVGTFLATINNNYRTLRANIANAATVAAVQAINVQSGWPSNP